MLPIRSLFLLAALAASGAAHARDAHDAHDPRPPAAAPASRLAVGGAVERPLSLGVEDLRRFPADQIVELSLPAREAGGQPARLKGVRLRAVLERAKIVSADHNTVKKLAVVAGATDGYRVVFSWSELFNAALGDDVLVVFERDGRTLAPAEGPLALISGKDLRTGPRHVKWLQSIDVRQVVQ